jgi:pyruvate,orthophosphate dikinase
VATLFLGARPSGSEGEGRKVILCRQLKPPRKTSSGMLASEGILTSRGGVSSHAALVARQMGKVCICGATDRAN